MSNRELVFTIGLSCSLLPTLGAQTIHDSILGDRPGAQFGAVFDVLGDLDGDGLAEFVVGDPADDTAGSNCGRALVIRGSDQGVIFAFYGDQPGDRLGTSVSDAGDVDADGIPDVLVGSPTDNGGRGAAHVFSGASGALLHYQRGLTVGDDFAYDLDSLGDVDGDGFGDYVVGVPGRAVAWAGPDGGSVYVYDGQTGERLHVLPTPGEEDNRFGTQVSRVGDVDGDGHADILAAGPYGHDLDKGVVGVYSGASGTILQVHFGIYLHGDDLWVGQGITGVGDVDGDGHADFAYGAYYILNYYGRLVVRSGANGELLGEYASGASFDYEHQIVRVGDLDGIGGDEVAFFRLGTQTVDIRSTSGGALIASLSGGGATDYGSDLTAVGDWDGDGRTDLAVGSSEDDTAFPNAGRIDVWGELSCCSATSYCIGAANSAGAGARMRFEGSTSIAANDLTLFTDGCPPNQFGLYYYGPTQIQTVFGDGWRCAGGGFYRLGLVSTGNGTATRAVDLTSAQEQQIEPGSSWGFQLLYRDPNGPLGTGFNASDGLWGCFCP